MCVHVYAHLLVYSCAPVHMCVHKSMCICMCTCVCTLFECGIHTCISCFSVAVIKYHNQTQLKEEFVLVSGSKGVDDHNVYEDMMVRAGSREITSQLHTGSIESEGGTVNSEAIPSVIYFLQ